jgi:hypothetical protein
MRVNRNLVISLLTLGLLGLVGAEPATAPTTGPSESGIAHTPPAALAALKPLIGRWHINANWSDGSPLDARSEVEWTLDHRFIHEKTFVKLPDGGEYQRYETMYGANANGGIVVTSFVYDGQNRTVTMKMEGGALVGSWDSKEGDATAHIEQRVEFIDNDTMHWQVWLGKGDSKQQIMDGNWKRVVG